MAEDTVPVEERAEKPTDSETVTTEQPEPAAATEKPEAQAEKPASEKPEAEAKPEGDATEAPPAQAEDAPAPEVNGTPASAQKSSKNRRVSTGTPKLNRKKSQSRITHLDAKPGQYFLARLRSFAPWPAIICDDEILPEAFQEARPVTAMQKDGSYKGEYADGGRRTHERTFPVMFFESNEFAWIVNTNLTPLDPAECKDISEKNKTKRLINAYKVASEAHDLKYFKKLLSDHQAAIEQEEAEAEAMEAEKEAEKEAAKTAKEAKKGKRKSKAADTDVEMEDADDSKKTKSASKKRKKDADTDGEAEKPAKTPKSNTKLKLTTPKAPAEEKKTPVSKRKAPAKRGKAAAASDDDTSADAKESEKPVDPEELKKKKEKESMLSPLSNPPDDPQDDPDRLYLSVLFLRHKLQKGFISRETPPAEDEMASMATYFDKLEKHADLEVSIIRSTKINKVLKMIVKLNTIPRDEEFNIRSRAMNILSSWKNVLDADTPGPADKSDKPAANGSKEDDGAETPKLETEEEKEPESKSVKDEVDSPMPDADAEKAPEPEKEADGEKPAEPSTEDTEKPTEPTAPEEKPAEESVEEKAEATA
ncbi:unnamed protein product [Penicillium olsonii]|nr:unnamed protein product [Penicillium olsonii]